VPLSAPGMRMLPLDTTTTDCILSMPSCSAPPAMMHRAQIVASLLAQEVPPAGCTSIDVVAFPAARLHPLP
jgi:hypothetical protein